MTAAMVAGAVANKPGNSGAAWTRMSWVKGLQKLGFRVHLVECLSSNRDMRAEEWFRTVMRWFGNEDEATLLRADGTSAYGMLPGELEDFAAECDLLLNISGHLRAQKLVDRPRCRIYLDLDPGYTQAWCSEGLLDLGEHDYWYTVGTQVGCAECSLPPGEQLWRHTLQPVCLRDWPDQPAGGSEVFTTVAAWRGTYGTLDIGARSFGPKAHEFRRLLPLPHWAPATFELALDIDPADHADREALARNGWRLCDPYEVAGDAPGFRHYIQGSAAELSVAQSVYVRTATGWFSDRTARYLASGRPAVVQDTGVGAGIPVGKGLVTFRSLDEAARAVEAVRSDYLSHCRSARRLAEEHLRAGRVLSRICEEVGVAP